jgi:hypothetical protein
MRRVWRFLHEIFDRNFRTAWRFPADFVKICGRTYKIEESFEDSAATEPLDYGRYMRRVSNARKILQKHALSCIFNLREINPQSAKD